MNITELTDLFGANKANLEKEVAELHAIKREISKARCVIEFDAEGKITQANEIILEALDYAEKDLIGQHSHILFAKTKTSAELKVFWQTLMVGKNHTGKFEFLNEAGKIVIFQGYFAPVMIKSKLNKVVAFLTDVTKEDAMSNDYKSQLMAISHILSVIEFDLKGNILSANENFLKLSGYTKEEIVGNHHSMFVDPVYKLSPEYKAFWEKLGRGEDETNQYKRFGKGGKEVWMQATYTPIFNAEGKPFKVVKYATDITTQQNKAVDASGKLAAISKIMAVIEFDLKGNISCE